MNEVAAAARREFAGDMIFACLEGLSDGDAKIGGAFGYA
jgi:hypothetical protein